MRSRSCVLPFALSFDYDLHSTLYIHTPAIDLVLIAYLDSMTMTSFNIFKARVIFKKLKVNAKMQIEQAVVLVGGCKEPPEANDKAFAADEPSFFFISSTILFLT